MNPSPDRADPARVSLVVVNYNRRELLADCLASLIAQTLPPLEIIIVDNGSTDGSQDAVRQLERPEIRLIPLAENQGFAAACNRGIESAAGDFVALLNNDASAEPGWLEALVQPLLQDPACGMCASKILLEGGIIDKVGHLIFWDGQNRGRGTGEKDGGQFENEEEVLLPDGCAAMYRTALLREVGGFDEDFFAYADDADLGLRVRRAGWTCRYVPKARVLHRHSATTAPYALQKVYWVERNRIWLAVKNFPWFLLPLIPLMTLYRWAWNLAAASLGRGAAGQFRRERGWRRPLWTILRANLDAVRGIPSMLRKRRRERSSRNLSDIEFLRILWRWRIRARELAFRDPSSA